MLGTQGQGRHNWMVDVKWKSCANGGHAEMSSKVCTETVTNNVAICSYL